MNSKNIVSTTARPDSSRKRGFTLVELLLVLTILAILAGIVLPGLAHRGEDTRRTAAKTQISVFVTALSVFEVDNGYFPRAGDGLQALMVKPRDVQNTWKGPYLQNDKLPLDPWKNPYIYEIPGKHNPATYDVYTKGKDGLGGTNTIGNWTTD